MKEIVMCTNCKNYELMTCNNAHFCDEYGGYVTEDDFAAEVNQLQIRPTTQPRKAVRSDG